MKRKQLLIACESVIKAMQRATKEAIEISRQMGEWDKMVKIKPVFRTDYTSYMSDILKDAELCKPHIYTVDNFEKETKMKKCEWKDGIFYQCNEFDNLYLVESKTGKVTEQESGCLREIRYYPYCGADIRKPEQEPIIKKSCGTWVAQFDGVDYLYTKDDTNEPYFLTTSTKVVRCEWKPISEIEITDEIAKKGLRPELRFKDNHKDIDFILYGVNPDNQLITQYGSCGNVEQYRLATVSDLED